MVICQTLSYNKTFFIYWKKTDCHLIFWFFRFNPQFANKCLSYTCITEVHVYALFGSINVWSTRAVHVHVTTRDNRVRPSGSAVFVHRVARCSLPWAIERRWPPEISAKTPIAVVIFSEHVKVNRGDGCSNEGCALAVLYLWWGFICRLSLLLENNGR